VTLHSKNGTVFVIQIFLYKYAFSRKIRIVPVFDKKQDTLIECLIECFKKDSGIPKKILCDNMLTMIYIFEDNSKKINDRFKQFASDYGFKVIPCQAYSPQTKGKVENEAKVMNRVFTLNNEFESETELIEKILYIEDDYNSTICKGTGIKPDILFANRERQELQSLPNEKFDNK
jgi:transposase